SVESFNSTYGSLTYYIGDEAGATTTLQVYGGLNIGGEKFTGMDDLAVGGTVLVYGNLKLYSKKPEIDLNSKIIEYTAPAMLTVDTPTFSIKSGEIEKGTTITIACATEGATIRYCMGANAEDIDENTVENWDIYESAIEITEPATIKAIAMKDGCINSRIAVASYTVFDPAKISHFDFTKPAELTPAQPESSDSSIKVSDVKFWSKSISFTASKGTSLDAQIYYTGDAPNIRVYQGATITISSEDKINNNITTVVFALKDAVEDAFEDNTISPSNNNKTYTWTGEAKEVTLKVKKSIKINNVKVQCENVINTGIDNVVVDNDENTPVEYYNLQGVRVENPAAGQLYIKRQGSKATKVIIR
ncbi:MAG: chitobiase/beta-hexosaminidase C-terminal domain-containing protein, partial [Muribaculaceae bacterium]|nr:chitobiase/beta-hexosaminidase C-terminal domain-containing protein [Muribaculaceae bacterium]